MRVSSTHLAIVALLGAAAVFLGCGKFTSSSQAGKKARETASAQLRHPAYDLVVGEPVVHGNLAIFPVSSRVPKDDDSFITLDEGLKSGVVEVFETGAAPMAANEVEITNEAPANNVGGTIDGFPHIDLRGPVTTVSVPEAGEILLGGTQRLNETPGQPAVNPGSDEANEEVIEPPSPELEMETETAPNEASPPQQQLDVQSFDNSNISQMQGASGRGNDVNRLMVWNKSDKPLYLMPGEIILGGDQDRTIGQELVLAPSEKPVAVEVFCVEHGRWGGRGADQTAALLDQVAGNEVSGQSVHVANPAVGEIAAEADRGKFIASVGQVSKNVRLAVQGDKAQGKVWENVAQENSKAGVSNASDTFTANYTSQAVMERLDPYIAALDKKVAEGEQVVGVIVAIDGKVASMDVFQSTPLFRKLWPKLLKSYALDAANESAAKKTAKNAVCSQAMAEAFLHEAMTHDNAETAVKGGLATTTRRSQRMTSFAAQSGTTVQLPAVQSPEGRPTAAPADASEAVHASEPVHVSAFAH